MPFEVFTKRMIPLSKDPSVTIQKKGIISMNASAYAGLGEPKFVELLYDAERRIVGIRGLDQEVDHAYPIRKSGANDGSILVSGIAFANHYEIPTEVATRRKAHFEEGVLCVDLNDPGIEVKGNRRRSTVTSAAGHTIPESP